jgi:UDP-N-acetyl-D-mannosaminuronic acid dehydrogenase
MNDHPYPSAVPDTTAATLDVVVVGGAGHVGLPMSLVFAQAGLTVGIYDTNRQTLDDIGAGRMPFREAGAQEALNSALAENRLELSHSPDILRKTPNVIVVIGTPIDEFMNPILGIFDRVADQIAPCLRPDALVVLRSTVYPGTSAYFAAALGARGAKVHVVFSPERVTEGNAIEELNDLPNIVGADDEIASASAEALFARLAGPIIKTSTREAELAKLLTNAWRYLKFAIANQFLVMSHDAGIDYGNVLHAVRTGYSRASDLPSPGFAAGPCLLKDTMQLVALSTDHFALGHAAVQANEGMPTFITSALRTRYGSLQDRTIGVLGMSFKAESDDIRSSLSYKLRKLLIWSGARVLCTDPFVTDERLVPLDQVLAEAEILVIGAPHRAYCDLVLEGREVVDIWGILPPGIRI